MQIILDIPDATLAPDKTPHDDVYQTRSPARIPTGSRPIYSVIDDLNDRIRSLRPEGIDLRYYDFSLSMTREGAAAPWPNGRWVACFPAKGSNEGYYVHIHVIIQEMRTGVVRSNPIAIAKVENEDLAVRLAGLAFLLLEA